MWRNHTSLIDPVERKRLIFPEGFVGSGISKGLCFLSQDHHFKKISIKIVETFNSKSSTRVMNKPSPHFYPSQESWSCCRRMEPYTRIETNEEEGTCKWANKEFCTTRVQRVWSSVSVSVASCCESALAACVQHYRCRKRGERFLVIWHHAFTIQVLFSYMSDLGFFFKFESAWTYRDGLLATWNGGPWSKSISHSRLCKKIPFLHCGKSHAL